MSHHARQDRINFQRQIDDLSLSLFRPERTRPWDSSLPRVKLLRQIRPKHDKQTEAELSTESNCACVSDNNCACE